MTTDHAPDHTLGPAPTDPPTDPHTDLPTDLPTDLDTDLRAAVRRALARHPEAVVVGTTAAVLWGAVDPEDAATRPALTGRDPVQLALDRGGVRPMAGVRVRRERLEPDEVVEHEGLRLSSPARTGYDVARRLSTVDAVVLLEALERRHGVTADDVRRIAHAHPHARGLTRMWAALPLARRRVASSFESRLRLALVLTGVRAPVVGHVVTDDHGTLYGVTDLAWPEERCALLCDRDDATARLMAGLLVAGGWTVQCVSRERFRSVPDQVVEYAVYMLRGSRRRLGLDRPSGLGWTRPRRRRTTIRTYGAQDDRC